MNSCNRILEILTSYTHPGYLRQSYPQLHVYMYLKQNSTLKGIVIKLYARKMLLKSGACAKKGPSVCVLGWDSDKDGSAPHVKSKRYKGPNKKGVETIHFAEF